MTLGPQRIVLYPPLFPAIWHVYLSKHVGSEANMDMWRDSFVIKAVRNEWVLLSIAVCILLSWWTQRGEVSHTAERKQRKPNRQGEWQIVQHRSLSQFYLLFGFFFPLSLSGCISKKYVREHIKSPLPMLFRDLVYTSSVVTKKPETTAGASRELQ